MSRHLQPPGGDSDAAGRDGEGLQRRFYYKKARSKKEEARESCFIIRATIKPRCLFKITEPARVRGSPERRNQEVVATWLCFFFVVVCFVRAAD